MHVADRCQLNSELISCRAPINSVRQTFGAHVAGRVGCQQPVTIGPVDGGRGGWFVMCAWKRGRSGNRFLFVNEGGAAPDCLEAPSSMPLLWFKRMTCLRRQFSGWSRNNVESVGEGVRRQHRLGRVGLWVCCNWEGAWMAPINKLKP